MQNTVLETQGLIPDALSSHSMQEFLWDLLEFSTVEIQVLSYRVWLSALWLKGLAQHMALGTSSRPGSLAYHDTATGSPATELRLDTAGD